MNMESVNHVNVLVDGEDNAEILDRLAKDQWDEIDDNRVHD